MVFSKKLATSLFVGGALALTFSIATAQTYFCETSSETARNNGFCRNSDLGNPLCYTTGSGSACSGSGYIEVLEP